MSVMLACSLSESQQSKKHPINACHCGNYWCLTPTRYTCFRVFWFVVITPSSSGSSPLSPFGCITIWAHHHSVHFWWFVWSICWFGRFCSFGNGSHRSSARSRRTWDDSCSSAIRVSSSTTTSSSSQGWWQHHQQTLPGRRVVGHQQCPQALQRLPFVGATPFLQCVKIGLCGCHAAWQQQQDKFGLLPTCCLTKHDHASTWTSHMVLLEFVTAIPCSAQEWVKHITWTK